MSEETKKYSRTEILLRALLIPNRDGLLLSALIQEFKATEGFLLNLRLRSMKENAHRYTLYIFKIK